MTPTLKQLTKNLSYINSNITEKNFPLEDRGMTDYKLFHFNRYISSENAVKEMEKEGCLPANLFELLSWKDWNEKDDVIALGSVGKVRGDRYVPCLSGDAFGRRLLLRWWYDGWPAHYRFLGVRNLSLGTSATEKSGLGHLESLTLESRISSLESDMEKIKKIINI